MADTKTIYLIRFLLLCLANSLTAFDFNWDNDVIVKYSKLKILSSCLGESFVQSWQQSVKSSTEKCFYEDSLGEMPTIPSILEDILRTNNFSPPRQNIPTPVQNTQPFYNYITPQQQSPSHPLPFIQNNNAYAPLNSPIAYQQQQPANPMYVYMLAQPPQQTIAQPLQILPTSGSQLPKRRIWKRSTTDDVTKKDDHKNDDLVARSSKKLRLHPEWRSSFDDGNDVPETLKLLKAIPKVNKMRKQLGDRISNITCVLKSMELLDENGMPNYQYNSELIRRLRIPEDLRSSLLESQNFCREFSMCVPVQRISNMLVREIGYSLVFMKCMKKKILEACMEHDMKMSFMGIENLEVSSFVSGVGSTGGRASYGSRSLQKMFDETPEGVAKDIENYFSSDDEVAFGF